MQEKSAKQAEEYKKGITNDRELKKILILSPFFPPCGGIGVFRVTKFVKYLPAFGYEPIVVTFNKSAYPIIDDSLITNFKTNIKIYTIDKKESKINDDGINFYVGIRKKIDEIILSNKPDIILATGGPFLYLPITRLIKEKYKIPYIIDLRDPWTLEMKTKSKSKKMKRFIFDSISLILEKYTFMKADAILTVNDTMTNDYKKKYKIISKNFITITNGYDDDDFKEIIPFKFNRFSILYSGKFQSIGTDYVNQQRHFRNPYKVLKAIKELNEEGHEIQFVHVGKKEEAIIQMAKDLDVLDYCLFTGFKNYNQTLEYCKGANILLLIGGQAKYEQTGKIFDYLGTHNKVLCLCIKDSEINNVAKTSGLIDSFELEISVEDIKAYILNFKNVNNVIKESNSQFTRYEITKKLVNVCNQILDKSGR